MVERGLVEEARRGDRDAFDRLVVEGAARLILVADRILRDADRAEDAVQQTLVAMWLGLPTLRDSERFEVWSHRLLVRFAFAEARRQRRSHITFIPLSVSLPGSDDPLELIGLRDEIDRAIQALSPDHRAVLVLQFYSGLSHAEIASTLGVPKGTVGSRLRRAMDQLRAAVDAGARVGTEASSAATAAAGMRRPSAGRLDPGDRRPRVTRGQTSHDLPTEQPDPCAERMRPPRVRADTGDVGNAALRARNSNRPHAPGPRRRADDRPARPAGLVLSGGRAGRRTTSRRVSAGDP
jgi:RNA polymerase sigma-70 factor, ECF subfamily